MPLFRIFFLRHNVLERAEEHELRDILAAIQMASMKDPELRAEIWLDGKKVGIIGPIPGSAHAWTPERGIVEALAARKRRTMERRDGSALPLPKEPESPSRRFACHERPDPETLAPDRERPALGQEAANARPE